MSITLRNLLLLMCLTLPVCAPHLQTAAQQPGRLFSVRNGDGRFGFIDKSGKLVIDFNRMPARTYPGYFSEGLAPICFRDESGNGCRGIGFIDETGKVVIEPRFKMARQFSEGFAYVLTEDGSGFIDRTGQLVINLKQEQARDFHEGLAAVTINQGRAWGFIDRTGRLVVKGEYTHVENFSEGLAAVATGMGREAKYGFINQQGEMVIASRFQPHLGHHDAIEFLSNFSEGLARAKLDKLYGYIDKRGEFVIKPQFREAEDFSEGLASVQTETGDFGYIDKAGRLVINLHQNARGYSFKEGLAAVSYNKFGYIDKTGKVVIEPRFDGAFEFTGGVAQVYFREEVVTPAGRSMTYKSAYIDGTGNFIWQPR